MVSLTVLNTSTGSKMHHLAKSYHVTTMNLKGSKKVQS